MSKVRSTVKVLSAVLLIVPAVVFGDGSYFQVRENESCFPFPTKLPVYQGDNGKHFDWRKYVDEATSKADRAYRALFARRSSCDGVATLPPLCSSNVLGEGESASDEMIRAQLAAEEYRNKCNDVIEKYRARLKRNHPRVLEQFNEYVALREKAIELEVRFEGGSWDGGSGARVAYPAARASALISFFKDLSGLASNYLQE